MNVAYKSICAISPNTHFEFVSRAAPAAHHDFYRLKENLHEILPHIDKDEVIILDKGFEGIEHEVHIGHWYAKKKAHKDHPLKPADVHWNDMLEEIRKLIELTFGEVKGRFKIVHTHYRHERNWIPAIWRFCCAIHNLMLQYKECPEDFSAEWNGPVPQLDRPAYHFKV